MSDDPTQDALEQASADTNAAWQADPIPERYAEHIKADEALNAYRASKRPQSGGPSIGGNVTIGQG